MSKCTCRLTASMRHVERAWQEPIDLLPAHWQSLTRQLKHGNSSVGPWAALSGSAITLHTPLVVCPLASLMVPAACPLPALKTPGEPEVRTAAASASSPLNASAFGPELLACACMPQSSCQLVVQACKQKLRSSSRHAVEPVV